MVVHELVQFILTLGFDFQIKMPGKAKTSFFKYEEDNMKAAIEAVRNGMPKLAAAKTYNVPR